MLDISSHTLWDVAEGFLLLGALLAIGFWAAKRPDGKKLTLEKGLPYETDLPATLTPGARLLGISLHGIWFAILAFGSIFLAKDISQKWVSGEVLEFIVFLMLLLIFAIPELLKAAWIQIRLWRGDHLHLRFPVPSG